MKRAPFALAVLLAFSLLGAAPAKPIDPLLWLVGGTWTADASTLGPGMLRIETRYRLSSNGSFVRFTTAFVSVKGAAPTYDGQLYYDPQTRAFAMWYADAKGGIVQGPVAVDGAVTSLLFDAADPRDGRPGQMRVLMTRKSADLYTWSLYDLTRDPSRPIFSLDYRRR
ncbi:MAG TPA: hypothetical protein VIG46_12490 [Candidatus Baltobacteraceae bacterium]